MIDIIKSYLKNEDFYIIIVRKGIYIKNYQKIINIDNKEIIVKIDNKIYQIKGEDLTLTKSIDNELSITGLIESINKK